MITDLTQQMIADFGRSRALIPSAVIGVATQLFLSTANLSSDITLSGLELVCHLSAPPHLLHIVRNWGDMIREDAMCVALQHQRPRAMSK
jgi:hypothetical protein